MVMAAYGPDSSKSMEMYKPCISSVAKVLRGGRRGGAKDFYITSDLQTKRTSRSVELVRQGMMCIIEPVGRDDEPRTEKDFAAGLHPRGKG